MATRPPWEVYGAPPPNPSAPPPSATPRLVLGREPPPQTPTQSATDAENLRRLQLENDARERDRAAGIAAQAAENERKASAFLIRAFGANRDYERTGVGPRSWAGQVAADNAPNMLNSIPGWAGNSPERQVSDTAQREFIAATLRQDSGAAIPPEEIENQRQIYFPMPGDGPEAIEQKRRARRRAMEGLINSAGRSLRPEDREAYERWAREMDGEQTADDVRAAVGAARRQQERSGIPVQGGPPPTLPQAPPGTEVAFWDDARQPMPPGGDQFQTDVQEALDRGFFTTADDIVRYGRERGFNIRQDQAEAAIRARANGVNVQVAPPTFERPDIDDVRGPEARTSPILDIVAAPIGGTQGVEAVRRGALDTLTLGLGDELAAARDTLFYNDDSYGENLYRQRAIDEYDQHNQFGQRLTGQLAGGLALPTFGARGAAQNALVGAGYGGAYGFGGGEGDFWNRLGSGAVGASIGGGVGGIAGGIGSIIEARAAARAARQATPIEASAEELAAAQGRVESDLGVRIPVRRADIDPQGTARRRGVARASEEGNRIIREAEAEDLAAMEAATGRLSAGNASADAFEAGERAQNVLSRADRRRQRGAGRFYDIADRASNGQTFTPEGAIQTLDSEIERLRGEGADEAIIGYLQRERDLLDRPEGWTATQLHAKRSRIRQDMGAAGLPVNVDDLPMIRAMDAASQDLREALASNPQASRALERGDQIWRERAQLRQQVTNRLFGRRREFTPDQTGRALASMTRGDSQRLSQFVDEMTPEERADFAADVAAQLGRDGQGNFSLARFLSQTEGRQALATPRNMRLLFGPDGARAINDLRAIARAKVAAASETNYSRTGNMIASAGRGLRTLLFAGFGASTGGPAGAVLAPAASSWVSRLGERRAARLLTNPDITRWIRNAPDNPAVANRYIERLSRIAARNPAISQEVLGLRRALMNAANDNSLVLTRGAASSGTEPNGNRQDN